MAMDGTEGRPSALRAPIDALGKDRADRFARAQLGGPDGCIDASAAKKYHLGARSISTATLTCLRNSRRT
jgi:hypothetical protein